jgi:hypothetical protein
MIRNSKQGTRNDDVKSEYKPIVQSNELTVTFLQSAYEKQGIKKSESELSKIKEAHQLFYEITYQLWVQSKNRNKINA